MPMFIFINGWCVTKEWRPKRTILKLVNSYIILQLMYIFFNVYIINDGNMELDIQFTTPYWLLWYLMALLIYYLLVPVILSNSYAYAVCVMAGAVLIAVLAGFDTSVGYYMSLSRTLVFFPYFACGYYVRNYTVKYPEAICNFISKGIVKIASVPILLGIIGLICYQEFVTAGALYGSYSYESGEFSFLVRVELMGIAFIWVVIFWILIPDRKIFKRVDTFPIFALHGFIVMYLRKHNPFIYSVPKNLFMAAAISVMILMLFGNKYVSRIVRLVLMGQWIERGWNRLFIPQNGLNRKEKLI